MCILFCLHLVKKRAIQDAPLQTALQRSLSTRWRWSISAPLCFRILLLKFLHVQYY